MDILRVGKVTTVDNESGMARVTYPDRNNATTEYLPVLNFNDEEYRPLNIGDMVFVLHMQNGSAAGVILGRYWSNANKPEV